MLKSLRHPLVLALSLCGLMMTACSEGTSMPDGRDNTDSSIRTPTPESVTFDPPVRFASDQAVLMPPSVWEGQFLLGGALPNGLPVVLRENRAYVGTSAGVDVINLTTGAVTKSFTTQAPSLVQEPGMSYDRASVTAPVLVNVGGVEYIVQPVPVQLPGQGTRAASVAVDVVTAAVTDDASASNLIVPLPAWASEEGADIAASALGQVDDILLVQASSNDHTLLAGVDLTTRQVRWQHEDLGRALLKDQIVVTAGDLGLSFSGDTLRGFRPSDGQEVWNTQVGSAEYVGSAGPAFILASGFGLDGTQQARLIDAGTGTEVTAWDSGGLAWACWYDQAEVVACAPNANAELGILAMDARTGEHLWELPDAAGTRISPALSGAWHGALYGYTAAGGPIVLDARTGADREVSPGVAPYLVNEYGGLARSSPEAEDMYFVPAIG